MIIRKPYAFLIRYFRFINFLILILSSYILYKSSQALDFFNIYVDTRQFIESDTLVMDIIPTMVVVIPIFLIIICLAIIVLFRKKDKPSMFYIFALIFYIIYIIFCIVSRGIIRTIMFEGIDPRVSRIIRDIWLIVCICDVAIVLFSIVRASGFDVKKFNFLEDIKELKIDDEDSEEYELTTKFDADKLKIKVAMQKEEFKAFFYENKFIIILISILMFVVIPTTFIAKSIISNKRYVLNEVIDLDNFNLKFTGAYVTKKNYNGDILFTGDNSYLIVAFNITNLKNEKRAINLNNMRLEVNNKIYIPTTNYYDLFVDIGKGYNNYAISKESRDYIVVYAISDEDLEHEMIVRYADKLTVKNQKVNALYYRTIIEPKEIDSDRKTINKTVNEDLIIDYGELKDTKFNVSNYKISDIFSYDVNKKVKYIINNYGLVMSLNYTYSSNNISFNDFIENYVFITYKYNGLVYNRKIELIDSSNTGVVYFNVNEDMKDATEISLVIDSRNTKYVYKLK